MGGYEKSLSVGRRAFHYGRIVKIIASTNQDWIVQPVKGREAAYPVRKNELQAVAPDVFPMGAHVQSKHTLTGKVTGYELASNRVIVVSDKIHMYQGDDKDRTRFSYGVNELSFMPDPIFELNGTYSITEANRCGNDLIQVLEHPHHKHMFSLYRVNTGEFMFAVDRALTKRDLPIQLIRTVHKVTVR